MVRYLSASLVVIVMITSLGLSAFVVFVVLAFAFAVFAFAGFAFAVRTPLSFEDLSCRFAMSVAPLRFALAFQSCHAATPMARPVAIHTGRIRLRLAGRGDLPRPRRRDTMPHGTPLAPLAPRIQTGEMRKVRARSAAAAPWGARGCAAIRRNGPKSNARRFQSPGQEPVRTVILQWEDTA